MYFCGFGQTLALQYLISSLLRLASLHETGIELCSAEVEAVAYNALALLDLLFRKLAPLVIATPISAGSRI